MMPILDNTELNRFGLEGVRFKPVNHDRMGGLEWAGPCPVCGGTDRLIVSNGYYWCRHSSICGFKGKLEKLGKVDVTEKERKQIERKVREYDAKRKNEQIAKIRVMNDSRIWEKYHRTLTKSPELIAQLGKDGITEKDIHKYQLGYTDSFSTYHYGKKHWVDVPAFSFPHFRGSTCMNIRMRILDNEYTNDHGKYKPFRSNLPTLFFPAYEKKDNFVVIVEGEKKAIVLKRFGIPAIGLWGIYSVKDEWVPWLNKRFEKRYLVYDTDNWNVIETAVSQAERMNATVVFMPGKPDELLISREMTPKKFLRSIGHDN